MKNWNVPIFFYIFVWWTPMRSHFFGQIAVCMTLTVWKFQKFSCHLDSYRKSIPSELNVQFMQISYKGKIVTFCAHKNSMVEKFFNFHTVFSNICCNGNHDFISKYTVWTKITNDYEGLSKVLVQSCLSYKQFTKSTWYAIHSRFVLNIQGPCPWDQIQVQKFGPNYQIFSILELTNY